MLDLNDLRVLTKVVDAHSFSRAADILGLPVSSVSARITRLEKAVGSKLLERTTRSLRLTEAGRRVYEQASRSLAEIDQVTANLTTHAQQPRGRVRITTTSAIAQGALRQLLPAFQSQYPLITLDVFSTSRRVDLIEEDFDLAIRIGNLASSSLVSKDLGPLRARLYAGPRYFADGRVPTHPRDIEGLSLLHMNVTREDAQWLLTAKSGETHAIRFTPTLSSNDEQLLMGAAMAGLGIASLPEITADSWVEQGALLAILPQWLLREVNASAIFPSSKGISASARLFVDFLATHWPRPSHPSGLS
jgi:DNA-binding transcriptional LysR family regulator